MGEGNDPDDLDDPNEGGNDPDDDPWPKFWQNPLLGSDLALISNVHHFQTEMMMRLRAIVRTIKKVRTRRHRGGTNIEGCRERCRRRLRFLE